MGRFLPHQTAENAHHYLETQDPHPLVPSLRKLPQKVLYHKEAPH